MLTACRLFFFRGSLEVYGSPSLMDGGEGKTFLHSNVGIHVLFPPDDTSKVYHRCHAGAR